MEFVDLYDENRNLTGEKIERGTKIPQGRYKLSVHMWVTNECGEIYVQKRATCRKIFPNKWENPGGGVVAGQDSEITLHKEYEEELGRKLSNNYSLIATIRREKDFVDIYHIIDNFDVDRLQLQVEEVAEAKWVTIDEINAMIARGEFCPTIMDSFNPFLDYIINKRTYKTR